MLKRLFKFFIAKHKHKEQKSDIQSAQKIFFAVFSRYGDGIISFKVIREFADMHKGKQYLLFTTSQLVPYAKEILGESVEVVGVNKRNPFSLISSLIKLKKFDADLGFNPWSHGDDAEFFISFAKEYLVFKRFKQWDKTYNLYARVREYLGLESKTRVDGASDFPKSAKNIALVPFSTDITKSLDKEMTKQLVVKLKDMYKDAKITICGFKSELKDMDGLQKFYFSKDSSERFLELLKESDLFVGVDAGPLHIANAMKVPSIGIFGPTAPETIVDFDWDCALVRDIGLLGIFCYMKDCGKAICIENGIKNFGTAQEAKAVVEENLVCKASR